MKGGSKKESGIVRCFVGLVAMTPASHAGGRRFDPATKYFFALCINPGPLLEPLHARRGVAVAAIAQLGERQTEDLEVPGSIPGLGIFRCAARIHYPQMGFVLDLPWSNRVGLMV